MTSDARNRPKVGLVLSGGGARGAYEVGVLRYIFERLKRPVRFDVITGSSVGAINGAYAAATADRPRATGRMLARVWTELRLDDVYRFGWTQMRNIPQLLFGRDLPKLTHGARLGGLVDPGHLQEIIRSRIPWRGISENIYRGHLHAMSIAATELATGLTTVFVQTKSGRLPDGWPVESGQNVVPTPITSAHCLASAAIPLLFPAVRVGDQLFVDGSLRQNTPVRPAMRLGATRMLVVSLRHATETQQKRRNARASAREMYPNAMFMMGKMFNALMLDKLEADLSRIQRTNEFLEAGSRLYGPDFGTRLVSEMAGKSVPYVPVEVVNIRPSQDFGSIAYDIIKRTGLQHYDGMMARWLRRAVLGSEVPESDLASYVLFDPEYTSRLIDMGYQDAAKQHDRLLSLFE